MSIKGFHNKLVEYVESEIEKHHDSCSVLILLVMLSFAFGFMLAIGVVCIENYQNQKIETILAIVTILIISYVFSILWKVCFKTLISKIKEIEWLGGK